MIQILKRIYQQKINDDDFVYQHLVDSFLKDPEFPWLISYPRTGSHWLRMIMELYFGKPSLVRSFYYKNAKEFTCYHQHDEQLDIKNVNKVIYIFRNPVDTVFSNLQYYKEDIEDEQKVKFRAHQYSDHLAKWLIREKFTKNKILVTYEGLKSNLNDEFYKITQFLGEEFNHKKLDKVSKKVSKIDLKRKTRYNTQIVNINSEYDKVRRVFRQSFESQIIEELFGKNPELRSLPINDKGNFLNDNY